MQARCMRRSWVLVTVLALGLGALPALAGKRQPSKGKAAVVNGSVITQEDFNMEMSRVQQRFFSMGRPLTDSQLSELKEEVLENLISRELLYQESQKKGIRVDDASINEELRKLKERFSSEDEFKSALRKSNLSEAAIRSHLGRTMAIQRFIEIEFAQKATVSDKQIKAYYDSHPDSFKQPEQVRASHILIKIDPQADESEKAEAYRKLEKIQERVQKGEDFGVLAKEFSQGPSSTRGGDLGYFRRGQMVRPFEEAAFALRPDEVSGIVETRFGYHLIKVVDKKPETTTAYKEVKEKLGQYLKKQKVQEEVKLYAEKLREKAEVKKFLVTNPE